MVLALACGTGAAEPWKAKDLHPVTCRKALDHPPLALVRDGQSTATICVMSNAAAADELQKYIEVATGAKLPIVTQKISTPAIVLGDCPEAAALGLVGAQMPPEGFAIKSTSNGVFIVGNVADGRYGHGVRWGVYEFLERYLGLRWYFPPESPGGAEIGQDIPRTKTLLVPAVWLEDSPVFRLREMWPPWADSWHGAGVYLLPIQTFLRSGGSWPVRVMVHQPDWSGMTDLQENSPEVFQLKVYGTRDYRVLCYGNPKTLEVYLTGIQNFLEKKTPLYAPISDVKTITVSPADVELVCYCQDCRKLWDVNGGQWGTASRIMATFVDRLAREIKKRWPEEGFTVIFLPYKNYTLAPDGFQFPDNVEVQICGMPGLATYKEPSILAAEQANIDKWVRISGRKIQNWHYSCWPAHKTKAAYQYPHVIKNFYLANRDKTVGSFINGTGNHWPRQQLSLYCWLKVLWNPAYDVDAAIDEFCSRMFGAAAATMRELIGLQISGWENSRWPSSRFSPKGVYDGSFPRADVKKMEALYDKALREAGKDALVTQRLNYYYLGGLKDFFRESKLYSVGWRFPGLLMLRVGEAPVIDGRLDDKAWKQAKAASFVIARGQDQGKSPKYPTKVKGVWTEEGVAYGFFMAEPTPDLLETRNGGHDNGHVWWDDNIEILLDVTGKGEGEFYHLIINPELATLDTKLNDLTWECKGLKAEAHRGSDCWSLEVFLPYAAFPDAVRPVSGAEIAWKGNFTRHRVADSAQPNGKSGSEREYQRMNTTGAESSDNLEDFSEIRFVK